MERHRSSAWTPATAALLLLLVTACGAEETTDPGDETAAGGAADVCLEGAADCEDVPTGTGGPESGPDGSVPVADAVAAGIEGPFLISGFYYAVEGDGARLCEASEESFPPQCGGISIALDQSSTTVDATTTTEGDVTWSDGPVTVEGEIVGDVFVVAAP